MTEPTSSLEPAPAWEEPGHRFDPRHDRRALAAVAGGLLAVAAVGYFVVLPLAHGSSSSDAAGPVAHHHAVAGRTTSAAPTAGSAAAPTPAPALKVRDPFSPLYAVAAGGGVGGSSAAPKPSASPVASATPTTIVLAPQPTVTTTVRTNTPKYALVFRRVVNTKTGEIIVSLNGKDLDLQYGSTFPDAANGPFRFTRLAVSINGLAESDGPATFEYGDSTFSMLVGETQTEN